MKLKVLKPHYFENKYRVVGSIYMTDIMFGKSAVKRGLCEEMKLPSRKDKQHPKTKKGKIEKK